MVRLKNSAEVNESSEIALSHIGMYIAPIMVGRDWPSTCDFCCCGFMRVVSALLISFGFSFVALRAEPVLSPALNFSTGMALFQDIYAPLAHTNLFQPHLRADGNIRESDSMHHIGIALECSFSLRYQRDKYIFGYQLGYRRAGSLGKKGLFADSAYSNMFTGIDGRYIVTPKFHLGLGLSTQRMAFTNISRSHTVLSILPRVTAHAPITANTSITAFFGHALFNRLGYARNVQLLGKKFPQARLKTQELGLQAEHKITANTSISLALSRKIIDIHLPDINTYKLFGLNLIADEPSPKNIPLRTDIVNVGLNKQF